ncbi:MAG: PAS domain S-box protein, partial [Thermodesulfobacteria bacterium]|nr:PAS domain S-box protein [Thermodesulfobacteriota bacterium]
MSHRDRKGEELWLAFKKNFERMLELTPWALALIDTDYRIRWINPELIRIFERPEEEVLERPCYEVFHGTQAPPENCLIRQIILSKDPEPKCLHETVKDKKLKICAVPVEDEGNLLGALHFVFDLSKVHQLRKDLIEKETILQSLLDAYPDIIIFKDRELRWKLANKATLETFNLSEDEWQGLTDLELAERHPEFREVFQYCHLTDRMALRKKGLSRSLEEVPIKGETRIYDVVKIPVYRDGQLQGLLVIGHDITPLKRTHLKIKEYANRLRTLLDGLPLGVIFVSPEGRIFEVNRKFCEIYGYRPEEIIGKKGDILFPDQETWKTFTREMLPAIAEKGSYETEVLQKRKDGSLFPLRALGRRLENRGRIWIVEDVTTQKEIEQRAKQLEKSLEQARRLESLAILTGAVAHDFNNLLTIILGRAQLLNQKVAHVPGAQRDLQIIIEACERAQDLVQQMLTFSGHQITEAVTFDL